MSTVAGFVVGGTGAWSLGGPEAFCLEYCTVTCSLFLFRGKDLFAVNENKDRGTLRNCDYNKIQINK